MHELAATESLLQVVLAEAAKAGAGKVTRISLRVGEWSSFVPECVRFYLDILAKGTAAEGAALDWETVSVRFECLECRASFPHGGGPVVCPECLADRVQLVAGREFSLTEIEVDDEHPDSAQGPRG